jgi:hypothetical protein
VEAASSRSSAGVSSSFADVALTDDRWLDHPAGNFTHLLAVSWSKTRGLVGNTIHPELFDVVLSSLNPSAIDVYKGRDVLAAWHPDLRTRIDVEGDFANNSNQSVGWHLIVKIKESACTLSASKIALTSGGRMGSV